MARCFLDSLALHQLRHGPQYGSLQTSLTGSSLKSPCSRNSPLPGFPISPIWKVEPSRVPCKQLAMSLILLTLFLFSLCLQFSLFFAWFSLLSSFKTHLIISFSEKLSFPIQIGAIYSPAILQNSGDTQLACVVPWLMA